MNILYLSCHSILEQEEVQLLQELGHQVFSAGAFTDTLNPHDNMRPGFQSKPHLQEWIEAWEEVNQKCPEGEDRRNYLTKEFVDLFDMVIVMHLPDWIKKNWNAMSAKRVIWRTIGQSVSSVERGLSLYRQSGLEIVRYSPMERNIPGYIGEDALIRFYKDKNIYNNWNGDNKTVVTVAQNMKSRDNACNFSFFEKVTKQFDRALYGKGNDKTADWSYGHIPFNQLRNVYRDNRVYFYTGTHPASYTLNFIEAWMTGIPIVAIGPGYGNSQAFASHSLYEIPNLIHNGISGFVSDDINQLRSYIKALLDDKEYAESISMIARQKAIQIFGKEVIKKQWEDFLKD